MASQSQSSAQDQEVKELCVMCNNSPARRCGRCRSVFYCSKDCQKHDFSTHKFLCKEYSEQYPRPSPDHKRAILFPADKNKPRMIWMQFKSGYDSGYYFRTPDYSWIGNAMPGFRYVEVNKVRGRRLGRGFSPGSREKQDGYCIKFMFRDNYLVDGSFTNRSIEACVRPWGPLRRVPHGPVVVSRTVPDALDRTLFGEDVDDVTLADFRHAINHLWSYYGTAREKFSESSPLPPFPFARAPPPAPAPADEDTEITPSQG
ncbi:hypothetical protein EYB26_006679 [Talaromyces marneffei]|uniref:uncharacterized protein n=1 Tax=Talaromyces marneffei TaxID=37727 RepID=UPI0012A7EF45|nr:uncharacterized protein EYB26_006679 [Talaromyces marneffei]QGA18994.1 hypothetical protein EYB26_006679 [Talaromyces marneffei]